MVGEKYASTFEKIQQGELCCVPLSKQHLSQGYCNGVKID